MNGNMVNGNLVGAKMLAYLRSEKDLFEERKRIAEMKKQLAGKPMAYWLNNVQRRRVQRFWEIVTLLVEDGRMSLTQLARKANMPVSTVFDIMKEVEKHFRFTIVLKEAEKDAVVRNTPMQFGFSYEAAVEEEEVKQLGLSLYAQ